MVIRNVNLETVCGITSKIPDNRYDEIAFAGKSNVGKSSLINALMNRKSLARISAKPGKTQTINFYNINDSMYLVDLPGYGYAAASLEIKAKWGQMIERYLHTSKRLKAVFLLVDIRHEPSENDIMMYEWMMAQGYAPIIVATKADKLKRSQIASHVRTIRDTLGMQEDAKVVPFSAETKQGREEIWELMESLTGLAEHAPDREENGAGSRSEVGYENGAGSGEGAERGNEAAHGNGIGAGSRNGAAHGNGIGAGCWKEAGSGNGAAHGTGAGCWNEAGSWNGGEHGNGAGHGNRGSHRDGAGCGNGAGGEYGDGAGRGNEAGFGDEAKCGKEETRKKPRWKKTDRPVAKKTAKKQKCRKAAGKKR